MVSNIAFERMQQTIEELKQISKLDFLIFTDTGMKIAETIENDNSDVQEVVEQFASSYADSQLVYGWFFFKIISGDQLQYILLCSAEGENAYTLGQMAAAHIRSMCAASREPYSKYQFYHDLLSGNIQENQVEEKSKEACCIPEKYILYILETVTERRETFMEVLENISITSPADIIIEMDEYRVALLKDANDLEADIHDYATTLAEVMMTEGMIRTRVSCSGQEYGFYRIAKAYQEGCIALKIIQVFYADRDVASYDNLGIARLIYQLPAEVCQLFLKEVFPKVEQITFDDETMGTINKLFENNLNISETARQLLVHRNTLVYRLERVQKNIGLDIRTFEDAMIFRVAMMVREHLNHMKKERE